MRAVSDTSPLQALAIICRLELLKDQFAIVLIPEAVWSELSRMEHPDALAALTEARESGWIEVRSAANRPAVEALAVTLDAGESEAIALARETGVDLLIIDESLGRSVARSLNLKNTGTLGILMKAKRAGCIPSMKAEIACLEKEAGFFVSERVRRAVLAECGEAPA